MTFGGGCIESLGLLLLQELLVTVVYFNRGPLVVVESGAAHTLIIQLKAKGLDQVKLKTGIGAKPDNVSGVRWDFRLI
jgi:hypothetical protein